MLLSFASISTVITKLLIHLQKIFGDFSRSLSFMTHSEDGLPIFRAPEIINAIFNKFLTSFDFYSITFDILLPA